MLRAVILTALPIEYLAVRKHLTNPQEEMHPQGTIYERGSFVGNGQSWEIGIAEVGAGNAGAAVEAERAIAYFKPDILFFVGIAGGIKDVAIGDVVAATDVYGYEFGKAEEQKFFTRPKAGKSSYALVQRAKSEARKGEWLKRLAKNPDIQPRVFVAPIAAGEKVIASQQSDVFRFLRASYNDAIAVEMEGFGFLSAAFAYPDIKAIVIRGISDLVEGKNDDSPASGQKSEQIRQEDASHHASAFAFEILSKLETTDRDLNYPVDGNQDNLASGKGSVAIGGSAHNSIIITGDNNVIGNIPKDRLDDEATVSTMNPQQKQRLGQRQQVLQSEWNLRNEKLNQLRKALAIETGVAVKFQLEQQIQEEEAQLQQLDNELNSLEQALKPPVNDSKAEELELLPVNQRIRPTSPNFFAYDDAWVGRGNLIHDLSDRIRSNCRLMMLVGITGIGKTALGERIVEEIADWFENDWSHYQRENFDDEQQASDFASVAARWLEKWGELVTPDDRKDSQRLLNRLIKHLRENRYLIQMDSLENILQGNEDEGWSDFKDEWWLKFFDSYLKVDSCESCFILTSQDLPGSIQEVGTRSQNFWDYKLLSGLEKSEQIELFEKIELDVSSASSSRDYLERIGIAYEGHPLALRVIAGEIKNKPFDGNVQAYWNIYGKEVEEVEKAIAEAQAGITVGANDKWQLDRFTKALKRNVRSRLNKTFKRLQDDAKWAYIMLCETSVYRCAVIEDFWLSHLEDWDRNEDEQRAALDALRDRYLVEELVTKDRCLLRQHNLIRGIALEHLQKLDGLYE
jgi:nucleoside phosphorylase